MQNEWESCLARIIEKIGKEKFWNITTVIILAAAVIVLIVYGVIYQYPQTRLNPYPPPTMPVALILPTYPSTSTEVVQTATPEQSRTATLAEADAKSPTETLVPATSTPFFETATSTETQSVSSLYPYIVRAPPAALAASDLNPDRQNCDWMGVAGQIKDLQDRPVKGILIQLGGVLDGNRYSQIQMSGTAINYGQAGYEFTILDDGSLISSKGKLYVLLLDQQYIPLSKRVYFDTYDDCEKNLTIIHFSKIR
jgi:hypothetical protein